MSEITSFGDVLQADLAHRGYRAAGAYRQHIAVLLGAEILMDLLAPFDSSLQRSATHEAGHALAAHFYRGEVPAVAIWSDGESSAGIAGPFETAEEAQQDHGRRGWWFSDEERILAYVAALAVAGFADPTPALRLELRERFTACLDVARRLVALTLEKGGFVHADDVAAVLAEVA